MMKLFLTTLVAACVAASPLGIMRNAVAQGDEDGDHTLNFKEFAAQAPPAPPHPSRHKGLEMT